MNHYYVIQDSSCPGHEFASYTEARDFLVTQQRQYPHDWSEARIVGPGLDYVEMDDHYNHSFSY